ncbi:uncharacterized protein [Dermacentor andersoni]|uniref:uncharacterized protein n=1 Tax=Dermacentor andersoni TaxID=34620 RepID=UPI002417F9A7|nr:uncharacterized protein LOC129384359 [Dermacentor andersoni]
MAELSEMYQASLRPHPPYKPLPDETGFVDYFSPPPVPPDEQGNYGPYYYYPPLFAQPPPPPPPPPPAPSASPVPYGYTGKSRASKTQGRPSTASNQAMENFMVYATLVIILLFLFSLVIMLGFAMAGKYLPLGKGRPTEHVPAGYSTRPSDNPGPMWWAPVAQPSNSKASASLPRRLERDDGDGAT